MTQPACAKNSWRFAIAARKSSHVFTGVFAAAASLSIHAFQASGQSIFDALSERQAGRICVPNGCFAMARWCSSESTGSSVVQTTLTFDRFIRPRAEKPLPFSFVLHRFQMRSADAPHSRSFTPK